MTVKDLLKAPIDIDVCDNYDESCYVAFVGPQKLTPKGKKYFEKVLKLPVEMHHDIAIINCTTAKETSLLRELFYGIAGYVSQSRYEELFVEGF